MGLTISVESAFIPQEVYIEWKIHAENSHLPCLNVSCGDQLTTACLESRDSHKCFKEVDSNWKLDRKSDIHKVLLEGQCDNEH